MTKRKLKLLNWEDLVKAADKEEKRLKKLVYIDGDYICFKAGTRGVYPIELTRCNSAGKVLSWIMHMTGKNWVTAEMIRRFVKLACNKNKITIIWA